MDENNPKFEEKDGMCRIRADYIVLEQPQAIADCNTEISAIVPDSGIIAGWPRHPLAQDETPEQAIRRIVRDEITKALKDYDQNALPQRVQQINRDPRRRC